ncbi:hypothetical protein D9619_010540 [Psilocybe cf. subviscida]|uniref:Uncharacterized protein n=1 Tax=Psilocybe cf. subviscida TaxID=2480587 RepID=A0A8H5ERQ6_9AGAR|nr:hypothetical protein D9619_010540 [Psilocybe cf. subviscida]
MTRDGVTGASESSDDWLATQTSDVLHLTSTAKLSSSGLLVLAIPRLYLDSLLYTHRHSQLQQRIYYASRHPHDDEPCQGYIPLSLIIKSDTLFALTVPRTQPRNKCH